MLWDLQAQHAPAMFSHMCGRFVASSSPEKVRRWFKTTNPLPNFSASYNVAPTNSIPVVRFNLKKREQLAISTVGSTPRL